MSQRSKHGSGHWWAQRLTAIGLLLLGSWFLISVVSLDNLQFDAVSAWSDKPFNSVLLFLTFATTAYHSQLGVQVVIEDYVHGPSIKVFSLRANTLAHVLLAGGGTYAMMKIGFGV